jgi:hypothetical protein
VLSPDTGNVRTYLDFAPAQSADPGGLDDSSVVDRPDALVYDSDAADPRPIVLTAFTTDGPPGTADRRGQSSHPEQSVEVGE